MPNLVGLRDMPLTTSVKNQAKMDTLKAMQMEALGLQRRDFLSTTDFKENKASYVSSVELESKRLVNKSSISKGERTKLEGWNNAWTHLHDDGTESQKLQDVNEGMGQTHRAKLMEDNSAREYTGESDVRGARGGRVGDNAGRVTRRSGRTKAKEGRRIALQNASHQPITRVRVPKGRRPTNQPNALRRQPVPLMTTVSAERSAKGDMDIASVPVPSIKRPIVLAAPSAFMACINIHKEQPQNKSMIKVAPSAANAPKEGSVGHNTTTSVSSIKKTTKFLNEKPTAHVVNDPAVDIPTVNTTTVAGKSAISVGSPLKADLLDLDIGQETLQPVLQFTAPSTKKQPEGNILEEPSSFDRKIEALERSGVLNATQLKALRKIQAQVHARAYPPIPVKEAPHQAINTRSELELLHPAAGVPVTSSIAMQFAEQQNAFLIGEHVHKTRYHTAASLNEDFEKLSIVDKKPAEPTTMDIPTTESLRLTLDKKCTKSAAKNPSTTEKSKINPFGPPPARIRGPSLPAHLLNRTTIADHGAAVRTQYLSGNDILASVSDQQQPMGALTAPTRPNRRNKINETGFIALAEDHTAGKKADNPLLATHKRGL